MDGILYPGEPLTNSHLFLIVFNQLGPYHIKGGVKGQTQNQE